MNPGAKTIIKKPVKEMKKIAQGAEAIIYETESDIIKHRFRKTYRHPEIDKILRKSRTRHEAKILNKLNELNIAAPRLKKGDEENAVMEMEKISGDVVKTIFDKNHKTLAKAIGKTIANMHKHNIIHGDLTTSNMIMNKKLHLIDFGLSFFSLKVEDKAVDLHLLDRALESKHYKVYPKAFNAVLKEYKKHYKDAEQVIRRLEEVKKRGRNKEKY